MTSLDKTLRKLMTAPPVKWPGIVDKLGAPDMLTLSRAAENDAERLAYLGAYLNARANGHASSDASKQARQQTAKVRRAMGYSYPKLGLANLSIA